MDARSSCNSKMRSKSVINRPYNHALCAERRAGVAMTEQRKDGAFLFSSLRRPFASPPAD
jgi:hypothetical protein